jgi:outer membrane receptor protein involved in Fe transport
VGVKRKDDNFSAGAGVVWRPLPWGEVRASYSYGHNGSTSDVNRYDSHSGVLGLSGTLRF